jgi:hypothetical protein
VHNHSQTASFDRWLSSFRKVSVSVVYVPCLASVHPNLTCLSYRIDTAQLSKIKGIEAEKVELYGDQFLRLIQSSKQLYDDMKRQETERANGGVVEDPNHKTVIELDSSDGYSSAEEIFNEHLDLSQVDDVRSRFFHDSPTGSQEVSSTVNRLSAQCNIMSSPMKTGEPYANLFHSDRPRRVSCLTKWIFKTLERSPSSIWLDKADMAKKCKWNSIKFSPQGLLWVSCKIQW